MHRDECDDGMPPEATSWLMSHLPFLYLYVNTLAICATNQAQKPAMKMTLDVTSDHTMADVKGGTAAAVHWCLRRLHCAQYASV